MYIKSRHLVERFAKKRAEQLQTAEMNEAPSKAIGESSLDAEASVQRHETPMQIGETAEVTDFTCDGSVTDFTCDGSTSVL